MSEVRIYNISELQGYVGFVGDEEFVARDSYAALQQKLDLEIKRTDACTQAERAWEKAMMAAIGEDGPGSVAKAIAELKAQGDALAAKNEGLAVECAAAKIAVKVARSRGFECTLNTPATDAYLNAVRAEGVVMFIGELSELFRSLKPGGKPWQAVKGIAMRATRFAAQLRAGAPKGDSE